MKKEKFILPLLLVVLTSCSLVPLDTTSDATDSLTSSPTSQSPTSDGSTSDLPSSEHTTSDDGPNPNLTMFNGFTYPDDAQTKINALYHEFWQPQTKVDLTISASTQIFKYMNQYGDGDHDTIDYQGQQQSRNLNEVYWPVNVKITVNGKSHEFDEVGMRRKGNTSRSYSFMDNDRVSDAFSFKLSFNEVYDDPLYDLWGLRKTWTENDPAYIERDDRTFLADEKGKGGMDKLDIKMFKTPDYSMINQPFAFTLFQKYGVISPNSTLGTIHVKSGNYESDMGVVTINEPVDKDLLKRYFPKASAAGDLYKVGWDHNGKGNLKYEDYQQNASIIGEENKFENYTPRYDAKEFNKWADDEKTILNSHEVAHAHLINLMRVLKDNQGKTPTQYAEAIQSVVDIDSFLMYAAISYLTGNPDDMRNNGNNYYIFFNPSENHKAYFIPYDYDWALGVVWSGIGEATMPNLSPFHGTLEGNGKNTQDNRLYYYTTINNQGVFNVSVNKNWANAYLNQLKVLRQENYYSLNQFNQLYTIYHNIYKNDTNVLKHNSSEIYNSFGGTQTFQNYLGRIQSSIDQSNPM